jgi:very-short-patch-repair endonuclease
MTQQKPIEQLVMDVIRANPGIQAREIVNKLNQIAGISAERNQVNQLLYGVLKQQLWQDKAYCWYLASHANKKASDTTKQHTQSSIAKLARYYLDCLSIDNDSGVSEFVDSKFGKPNYAPLASLPLVTDKPDEAMATADYGHLLHKLRKDRHRLTLYLGYPLRLRLIKSKRSNWEGFMLEPLFLFPIQLSTDGQRAVLEPDASPLFNFAAWKGLSVGGESNLMQEIAAFSDELGLNRPLAEQPDWDEVCHRFAELTATWDWKEPLDPHNLITAPPITDLREDGIYNRAVLLTGEASKYTRGLESELSKLTEKGSLSDTVLHSILDGAVKPKAVTSEQPLLEILPLNSEQREAVRQALTQPLTVITGPPGTGKSQVVSAILANAAWHNMKVLFASKNNKAVDVVESRVNSLAARPIVMRLGASNDLQARLVDYLTRLLSSSADVEEERLYETHLAQMKRIQERFVEYERQQKRLIEQRNKVDTLDQVIAHYRDTLPRPLFQSFRQAHNLPEIQAGLSQAIRTLKRATKEEQGVIIRLLWPLLRKSRLHEVIEAMTSWKRFGEHLGINTTQIPSSIDETTIPTLRDYLKRCSESLKQHEDIASYSSALEELKELPTLDVINRNLFAQTEQVVKSSDALWKSWVQLQPKRLSTKERKALSDYVTLLRMIVKAGEDNEQPDRGVWRRYYNLLPQVARCLPCWAVTSLSANGRIPLEEGFFDLVVIDEASQCDIASALPLIYRAKRLVVIGDPQQLRHISTISRFQDMRLLEKHQLENNFLSWSYGSNSLFDLAQASVASAEQIVMLRDHHRSHAQIIEFSNRHFYKGVLRIATKQQKLKLPARFKQAIRWVDVQGKVVRPSDGGAVNQKEVQQVIHTLHNLLVENPYEGSVGIVSPFRAQANAIRQAIHNDNQLSQLIGKHEILVDTVHKFQGDERDVMVFSPVVSQDTPPGALGFLRTNGNLFNVAITRARALLLVVGDLQATAHCGVTYLEEFASYVHSLADKQHNNNPTVDTPILGDSYPPVANPEDASEWEKIFYKALYMAGLRPIPQYKVEHYALDLALFAKGAKLNVEIDGENYHKDWNGELLRRDRIRNSRLIELGWDVKRFWVYQIRDDLDKCVADVANWQRSQQPTALAETA